MTKLKKLLDQRAMTARQFALLIDMPERTVQSYVSGDTQMSIKRAKQIARKLHVKVDEII